MITLYRFGLFLGAPDSSPFVIKTMMLLKLAGLECQTVQGNPLKAPMRFLPYIDDDGVTVADSTLIRRHLERKYKCDFDAALTREQRAQAWAVERMCEDHLYFAMLENRWLDPINFRKGVATMFGVIPAPLRPIARVVLRRMNAARLRGQGLGRHSKTDIAELASCDIAALATILGNKPYLMGDEPCGADASVFGIITSVLTPPLESPLRDAMSKHRNLVAYRDRVAHRYFAAQEHSPVSPA
jgi:glutathione S-transferase